MGLKETFQKAAQVAAKASGDLFEDVTYTSHVSAVYEASSDTASAIRDKYLVSMVFEMYNNMEVANSAVEEKDVKGTIPQLNLPCSPSNKDTITRVVAGVSTEFELISHREDPAGALWVLQFREK